MHEARIVLCKESQPWADEAIDALGPNEHLTEHPALDQLTAWLDADGRMVDYVCQESTWVHAPELSEVVSRAFDSFEGRDVHDAILQLVDRKIAEALAGDPAYWGDEYQVPIIAYLHHSDGRSALLCYKIDDYVDGPYQWQGLFPDRARLDAWLRAQGRILSMAEYEAIPRQQLLAEWGKLY